MNPFIQKIVGSAVRAALLGLSGWLLADNSLTPDQQQQIDGLFKTVAESAPAVLALAWSFWEKYATQRKIVTALAMPTGSTELMMEKEIKAGTAPPVTVAKDEAPFLKAKEE